MTNTPENTIIDLRDAVQAARQYFANLFSDAGYVNVRLEEVAISEDRSVWLITLGYDVPEPMNPTLKALGGMERYNREYKSFEVDAHDGFVKSMKIRKV